MSRTQITGRFVKDNSLSNADLELANPGQIVVFDELGKYQAVTMSGDATIDPNGVVTVNGISGSSSTNITPINSSTTLTSLQSGLIAIDALNGPLIITLPISSSCVGREFTLIKIDSSINIVTISSGSSTFFGKSVYEMKYQFQHFIVVSDGTNWIVNGSGPIFGKLKQSDMPAVYNNSSDIFESINRIPYIFQNNGDIRNSYLLNYGTFSSQSPNGALIPRNSILKTMWVSLGQNTGSTASFQVRIGSTPTTIATLNLAIGVSTGYIDSVNVLLNAGDRLSVFVSNTSNVRSPQVVLEFAWRD